MTKPLPLLRLLGPLQLQSTSGENLSLRLRKAEALLAYLAVQTQPVSRRVVADLLWADSPPQRRRANLSLALHAIGQVIPNCIEATAAELLLPPSAPLHIDTRLFATFSADGDPVAFSRAVSHYRGEFLEGFYVDGCPDFETWIIVQREQWRLQVVELLERLFHYHLERSEYDRSIDAGLRLLTIEPWREESHRRMMLAYALSGQRSSALAQFESCRRLLRSELGVDPLPETVRLYEQIQRNDIGAPQHVAVKTTWTKGVHHNLPMPLTSFVQSGTLLADIATRLRSSDCRLLTLTGPGGVGKTRAAVEAAMQMADTAADLFADGIYYVRTAHVEGEEALLSTIADSVGFTFGQSASPWDQLLSFLSPRRLLLVIDNFEHLVELTPRVVALLRSCPHLKLLITSRIRLQVSGEWVLTVEGLRYPPSAETLPLLAVEAAGQPGELGDLKDGEAWDAVRLFAHRARQVEPSFELTPETLPAVIRICQLLEGLPLGLELAASWVPLLSCQEIVAEIERSLDFLVVPPATSLNDDQLSLAAVFEQTWQMLDEVERRTLRRLSVFHGGFDRYAAEQITGASLLTLSTLVRKSILQRSLSGRMALLAVLHRYAEIRLAAHLDEWRETQRRHAAYYAAFVQARTRMLASRSHARAVSELTEEIRNIRLAWQHAVAWRMLPALGRMATGLALYYEIRGWFQEARHAYTIAVDMPTEGDSVEELHLRGILASHLGRFLMRLGDHVGAEAVLRRSVALLDGLRAAAADLVTDLATGLGYSLSGLAYSLWRQGRFAEAGEVAARSMAMLTSQQGAVNLADAHHVAGLVADAQGRYADALAHYWACHDHNRNANDLRGMAHSLHNLADTERMVGRLDDARQHALESLKLYQELDYVLGVGMAMGNLGRIALAAGDLPTARQHLEEALRLRRQLGNRWGEANSLKNLGALSLLEGNLEEARRQLCAAAEIAIADSSAPLMCEIMTICGRLLEAEGKVEAALTITAAVLAQPSAEVESRTAAQELQSSLMERQMGSSVVEAALARGAGLALTEAAALALSTKAAE